MFVFRKICRALLSCYLRFEIRPFALLPTIYKEGGSQKISTVNAVSLPRNSSVNVTKYAVS